MTGRNTFVPHNTEDRAWWHIHGENLEKKFVELCRSKLNLNAIINPEKDDKPYVPDLIVNDNLADLKTQNTPFFTANRYGIEPRFAVTFNKKDYIRYKELYPDLIIYFWIDWQQLEWKDKKVEYYGGIFSLPFAEVAKIIEAGAPEHEYMYRQDPNDINSKSSYVLDIRHFNQVCIFENSNT